MEALSKYWKYKNGPEIPFEPGKKGGKALREFLKEHHNLTLDTFQVLLNNRAKSEGVSHSTEIYRWLPNILSYGNGPLTQYKTVQGDGNGKAGQIDITRAGAGIVRAIVNDSAAKQAIQILRNRDKGLSDDGLLETGIPD